MILIKNIEVYAPEFLGIKDVLIAGNKIEKIGDNIEIQLDTVEVLDGTGKKMIPGLIDQHVHITGGGGEGSFKTRVPECTMSSLLHGGVTTVFGLLGTDASTRSVENLVAKVKALKEEGVSAYCYTGSYEYPTVTLTGSVRKDIVFIEEVVGAKTAISDHRSSNMTKEELGRLASDVRAAGMLCGKAGILTVHMGSGKRGMLPLIEIVQETDIPARVMRPTHVNRAKGLLMEAYDYAKLGGIIDLSCGMYEELRPAKVLKEALEQGVPVENMTFSSDGYGSWSKYDDQGLLLEIGYSKADAMIHEIVEMVKKYGFTLQDALPYGTSNVAKALNIYPKKGTILAGSDADMVILSEELTVEGIIANGKKMMMSQKILVKGTYE